MTSVEIWNGGVAACDVSGRFLSAASNIRGELDSALKPPRLEWWFDRERLWSTR